MGAIVLAIRNWKDLVTNASCPGGDLERNQRLTRDRHGKLFNHPLARSCIGRVDSDAAILLHDLPNRAAPCGSPTKERLVRYPHGPCEVRGEGGKDDGAHVSHGPAPEAKRFALLAVLQKAAEQHSPVVGRSRLLGLGLRRHDLSTTPLADPVRVGDNARGVANQKLRRKRWLTRGPNREPTLT